jgi:hypothetical protein
MMKNHDFIQAAIFPLEKNRDFFQSAIFRLEKIVIFSKKLRNDRKNHRAWEIRNVKHEFSVFCHFEFDIVGGRRACGHHQPLWRHPNTKFHHHQEFFSGERVQNIFQRLKLPLIGMYLILLNNILFHRFMHVCLLLSLLLLA